MDYFLPISVMNGYYANVWGLDDSTRPWTNNRTTWLMPVCKKSDTEIFTFFGYKTSSPFSYQNQGAYSCDAYKDTANSPKTLSLISPVYWDKLKTFYGLPLPDFENTDNYGYARPIIPLVKKTLSAIDGVSAPIDSYYELDWANTTFSSTSSLSANGDTNSWATLTTVNIVSPTISISTDDPSGGSTSDYSGIISAITLIPATIICVCLFKMIFNVFMNRKVRG